MLSTSRARSRKVVAGYRKERANIKNPDRADRNELSEAGSGPKKNKKKKKPAKAAPPAIGWREWAALPDLGVDRIKAKIDTGAKTSAIHAVRVRAFERGGGVYVSFDVHPIQRQTRPEIECVARVIDRRRVRSSNGEAETRYIIMTSLDIGGERFEIEMSLANRDDMGFRLLLGRDALKKRFVVDPAKSFRFGK